MRAIDFINRILNKLKKKRKINSTSMTLIHWDFFQVMNLNQKQKKTINILKRKTITFGIIISYSTIEKKCIQISFSALLTDCFDIFCSYNTKVHKYPVLKYYYLDIILIIT